MNPLIPIIAQYGLQFTIELIKLLKSKPDPTAEDFQALADKYANKSASEYLDEAKARVNG